jgi:hypothetical protein
MPYIIIFFNFHNVHFCSMFLNNKQFFNFILPLLHVSTRAYHHQGALPCLLSYMRIECNG